MRRFRRFALVITLALAAFGTTAGCGGDKSCKNACDKINACGLKSSGLSCDNNCAAPQDNCAVCVNDRPCDEILANKCAADCPNVSFAKQ